MRRSRPPPAPLLVVVVSVLLLLQAGSPPRGQLQQQQQHEQQQSVATTPRRCWGVAAGPAAIAPSTAQPVAKKAGSVLHQDVLDAAATFPVSEDLPEQRAALMALFDAVCRPSDIAPAANASLRELGYPGLAPWGAANVSYCLWLGVSCCGTILTSEVQLCQEGHPNGQSVSALELPAVGLAGSLPDVFDALPDLQVFDVSYNRGLRGALPDSFGGLTLLWSFSILGTAMRCNDTAVKPPPCPLPPWLKQQQHEYYYERSGVECPVIGFTEPRQRPDRLALVYRGALKPEVFIPETYYDAFGCLAPVSGSGLLGEAEATPLPAAVLVIVILVPSLAVSVGLVLLSVALMRYLTYLKRSHDAIHLTEAWKRRNPPGIISDGNDRVLREVTLVITDVEGSTELWEWDYGVMTLAQEVHDSVMRSLIGRYCGYEVTTEGDSFTVAFHDAFDAVCWSLAMQQAMLEADWPEELLSHDKARTVFSSARDSSRPGTLLFRGLRVRVAINTGIPSMVYSHELTNTLMYAGPVMDLVTSLSDMPAGGQVLLGPQTFSAIASRLAELGVRLMLTETEAAAAGGAGGTTTGDASMHLAAAAAAASEPAASRSSSSLLLPDRHKLQLLTSHSVGECDAPGLGGSARVGGASTPPGGSPRRVVSASGGSSGGGAFPATSGRSSNGPPRQAPAAAAGGGSRVTFAAEPDSSSSSPPGSSWLDRFTPVRGRARAGRKTPFSAAHSASSSSSVLMGLGVSGRHQSSLAHRALSETEEGLMRTSTGLLRVSTRRDSTGLGGAASMAAAAGPGAGGPLGGGGGPHAAAAAAAIQDNEHIPMVIDLGSHWLDGLGILPGNPTAALQGVRLTQIVTRQLAPRASHFPPLATPRQIYPSFFEAPCAAEALLPDGLVFSGGRLPLVTMAFCAPDQHGLRHIELVSPRAAKSALDMFCSAVRTTLNACGGYECQEKDGIFMLAFAQPAAALEWACLLNLSLMCVHWAPEVLDAPAGREVYGPSGELLFRGLRARVGIYKGDITRIIPHRATGRADYFGPPVNRAARFLAASAPGQILAERGLVEGCVEGWRADDQQAALERRALRVQASFGSADAPAAAAAAAAAVSGSAARRASNSSTIVTVEEDDQADAAAAADGGSSGAAAAAAAAAGGSPRQQQRPGAGRQQEVAKSFSFNNNTGAAAAAAGGDASRQQQQQQDGAPQQQPPPPLQPAHSTSLKGARSISGKGSLPTLFESDRKGAAARGAAQQQQQQQQQQGVAAAAAAAAAEDPLEEEMYAGFGDASSSGSEDDDEGGGSAGAAAARRRHRHRAGRLPPLLGDVQGGGSSWRRDGSFSAGAGAAQSRLRSMLTFSSSTVSRRGSGHGPPAAMGAGGSGTSARRANDSLTSLRTGSMLTWREARRGAAHQQQLSRQVSVGIGGEGGEQQQQQGNGGRGGGAPSGLSHSPSLTTAAALAAAVYRNDSLCRRTPLPHHTAGSMTSSTSSITAGAPPATGAAAGSETQLRSPYEDAGACPPSLLQQADAAEGGSQTLPSLMTSSASLPASNSRDQQQQQETQQQQQPPGRPPLLTPQPAAAAGAAAAAQVLRRHHSLPASAHQLQQPLLQAGNQQGGQAEPLTGALPLEALPALRLSKLAKHQSFMLQAIKDQVHRSSREPRVPMRLQVHDQGTWAFKGISGAHPVVMLLPSRLAGRLAHAQVKKSSKAVCMEPAEGLLAELWVEVINMDAILLDPELLLAAGLAPQQQQPSGGGGSGSATLSSAAGGNAEGSDSLGGERAAAAAGGGGGGASGVAAALDAASPPA